MRCAALVCALACLIVAHVQRASPAPLSVASSVERLWSDVVFKAAERTVQAVQKQTGLELSLRDVPLDSLQLLVGRQHHLAVEIGGREYEITINSEGSGARDQRQHQQLHTKQQLPPGVEARQALPHTALAEFEPSQWQAQHMSLPEITLTGPVELVLPQPTAVTLWLPHAADADRVRRLLIAPGATVTLSQLKGISLRRPLQLPKLPASYLAEVAASAVLGHNEPGFENAPGLYYLANELYRAATNASLPDAPEAGAKYLLSFTVDVAGPSLTLASAPSHPALPAPRLKVKKQRDGSLEVSLREPLLPPHVQQGQQDECDDSDGPKECSVYTGGSSSGSSGASSLLLPHRLWAWPLPLVDMSDWVPYEQLLRSVLTSHPFDMASAAGKGTSHKAGAASQEGGGLPGDGGAGGLPMRLTKSSVRGVSLMRFEMQLRGAALAGVDAARIDPNFDALGEGSEGGDGSLQVWEAVVQVQPAASGGLLDFHPVSVKRKHAYHSTLTLSPHALALLMGKGNASTLLGFESRDEGFARRAAEEQP